MNPKLLLMSTAADGGNSETAAQTIARLMADVERLTAENAQFRKDIEAATLREQEAAAQEALIADKMIKGNLTRQQAIAVIERQKKWDAEKAKGKK